MAPLFSRAAAEAALVRALSRQIGYTTGAYSIERMAQSVHLFSDATAYQFALVKLLQDQGLSAQDKQLTEKYASEVLNFVTSLGILQRLPNQGSAAHLTRFGLTDAGVTLRATERLPAVRQLVLTDLVLENDADAYIQTLHILERSGTFSDASTEFRERVMRMREARLEWLRHAFPNKSLLERITERIVWIKKSKLGQLAVEVPKTDFGRHHFAPRKSWAAELGHIDGKGAITPAGRRLLLAFRADEPTTWLAPRVEAIKLLKLDHISGLEGPHEPALDLLRPRTNEEPPSSKVVDAVSSFLQDTFESIRLHHARQASVAAARYYLRSLEAAVGHRISWEETIRRISQERVERFSFFTNRQGAIAYYQVRRSSESN